jgi:hypothetical protein
LAIQNERDVGHTIGIAIHPGLQILKAHIKMIAQVALVPGCVIGSAMRFTTQD